MTLKGLIVAKELKAAVKRTVINHTVCTVSAQVVTSGSVTVNTLSAESGVIDLN